MRVTQTETTVRCEKAAHGTKGHPMVAECVWPHEIAPAGAQPALGHPYTVHD